MSIDMLALQAALSGAEVNHKQRRDNILSLVREKYSDVGPVILFSPCDQETKTFEQDSYFFYFSGVIEPASAIVIDDHKQSLYIPQYSDLRGKWVADYVTMTDKVAEKAGFDELKFMGEKYPSIHVYPYFEESTYKHIIEICKNAIAQNKKIGTIYPRNSMSNVPVRQVVDRLANFIPELHNHIVDISPAASKLRRKKDISEIEMLHHAVEITDGAHNAAVHMMKPNGSEAEIQAALEYIFTENKSVPAYPSIVAGGDRANILHYTNNDQTVVSGDLVLLDAGARYNYYCADITRTYPVSGEFSKRQREIYEIVLQAQKHVVDHVKPGVWLSNKDEQEASLQHIALKFLKEHDLDKYYYHGIGHFLGLDVHDVGDITEPLDEGDVITVEPGLYMSDEKFGVRIEDNYWVVKDGEPVCLSQNIPKEVEEVELMVQQTFDVDQS